MRRPFVAVALAAALGVATATPASAPAAPTVAFVRPVADLAEPPPPPRQEAPAAAPVQPPEPPPPPPPAPVVSDAPPVPPQESPQDPHPRINCGGWEATVAAHFPPEQVAKGCAVLMCESRGDPTIANEQGSGASGLWQFLDSTWRSTTGLAPPAAAYSPDQQTAGAAALWRSSGWGPWSCA